MSLRLRLTLLYTTLFGGATLILGVLVYGLVSYILLQQVDTNLSNAANQIIDRLRVNSTEQFDTRLVNSFQTTDNLIIQLWGTDERLIFSRPFGLSDVLDEDGRQAGTTEFNSIRIEDLHLRVLSVPLQTDRRPVGVVQFSVNLSLVDVAQSTLFNVLLVLSVVGIVLTVLIIWLVLGRALRPLSRGTAVATQIINADDLSRRIPLAGLNDDEIGRLIRSFNQTLERVENLFSAQRRFLADVSHELRTPLTVIKGNVGLMRKIGADEESLEGIDAEVDRLTRLVGDLLVLAQAESGRMPMSADVVELDTLLTEVYQQMRLLAGEKVQLHLKEIEPIVITGDRDRLKQVLLNLVGNAVQYTPAGGSVNLSLTCQSPAAVIKVHDSGPGIPAEDLPHIFERFYRGEKSRTRTHSSGFGLGLSIAYWIVRNHGGNIEVTSAPGQGTTFAVFLPTSQSAPPPAEE